ncbi:HEAT repeat domain-containing protein [Gemmatimonas sp.]|nr:HEAT repeat domain-containing protein [Gemmatimonas sp.]
MLGNVAANDDAPLLDAALQHDEPLVREHAAWALTRITRTTSD